MLPLKSKIWLFPYWAALKIRHFLYDRNIKKSVSYPVPVICIGNITVGGTGKTPHTELLIRLLQKQYKVAVLSRGYKRKTKGFRIARVSDGFEEVGDEPLQIKQKFPDILVAVCAERQEGIEKLLALPETGEDPGIYRPELIILDDAYQHRKVKPSHSVVLMNYNNPIFQDNLLPLGRLRDLPEQVKRAESVIISKSPLFGEADGIIDEEKALERVQEEAVTWRKKLQLSPEQKLYFSIITYGSPVPVFYGEGDNRYIYSRRAVYFTGIANDQEFRDNILGSHTILDSIKFEDHRNFSKGDAARINHLAKKYPMAVIFTTEKDSKRLISNKWLAPEVRKRLFYIPIEVQIIPDIKQEEFSRCVALM